MKRTHRDRCPGLVRPWIADDGAIVRLRLVGGSTDVATLTRLAAIADRFGDGTILITSRANLQLRGIGHDDGCLPEEFADAIVATGLIPHPEHELVRNIMVSPASGIVGGQADLRGVAERYDALLVAEPALAGLSARFLTVFDDGRGDVVGRDLDLGAMAVDAEHAQLRIGSHQWGDVVALTDVAELLVGFARSFIDLRGDGPDAPWHIDELPDGAERIAGPAHARDLRTHVRALPLPFGRLPADTSPMAHHLDCADDVITTDLLRDLTTGRTDAGPLTPDARVVVTPWRSLLIPLEDTA